MQGPGGGQEPGGGLGQPAALPLGSPSVEHSGDYTRVVTWALGSPDKSRETRQEIQDKISKRMEASLHLRASAVCGMLSLIGSHLGLTVSIDDVQGRSGIPIF